MGKLMPLLSNIPPSFSWLRLPVQIASEIPPGEVERIFVLLSASSSQNEVVTLSIWLGYDETNEAMIKAFETLLFLSGREV